MVHRRGSRDKGVAAIPDDPLALACVPGLTVRENLALGSGRRYRAGLGVDWQRLDADMQRSFARMGFPASELSRRAPQRCPAAICSAWF